LLSNKLRRDSCSYPLLKYKDNAEYPNVISAAKKGFTFTHANSSNNQIASNIAASLF